MPLGGHLQAKEKGEDPKPPGGRQWKLNLVRWVSHGERYHRQLRKTRPGGKETLLRPYAPLGAIRTNNNNVPVNQTELKRCLHLDEIRMAPMFKYLMWHCEVLENCSEAFTFSSTSLIEFIQR